jgi:hypothetical protein
MKSQVRTQPAGFAAVGVFFFFGAAMACYAAVTLLHPGTFLDHGWDLNPSAHEQLLVLGRMIGVPFIVLSVVLGMAGVGWFRRRFWGWLLGFCVIAINLGADAINLFTGERLKGAIGVLIAGLLLIYIARARVRNCFSRPS